jgi:hypothetical protein
VEQWGGYKKISGVSFFLFLFSRFWGFPAVWGGSSTDLGVAEFFGSADVTLVFGKAEKDEPEAGHGDESDD